MARSRRSKVGEKAAASILAGLISIIIKLISFVFTLIAGLFQNNSTSNFRAVKLAGNGRYRFEIVGESHYQSHLESLCGGRKEESAEKEVEASLVLDDHNPHDNLAVRVDIGGSTVGYLSRENARKYRNYLEHKGHRNVVGTCPAIIVGGWHRSKTDIGSFGVKLDLVLR